MEYLRRWPRTNIPYDSLIKVDALSAGESYLPRECLLRIIDAPIEDKISRFGAILHTQLIQDALHMLLYRFFGNVQLLRNDTVALALNDKLQYLALARG